ncbi:hypothetical protein [Actinoallomurus sp. CA-150999]|uniref:hypothetical protein n=1 Tax=Actinoallomurus sp. CA-150999 TaxID=3239887 RepID=UPI003D9073A9
MTPNAARAAPSQSGARRPKWPIAIPPAEEPTKMVTFSPAANCGISPATANSLVTMAKMPRAST